MCCTTRVHSHVQQLNAVKSQPSDVVSACCGQLDRRRRASRKGSVFLIYGGERLRVTAPYEDVRIRSSQLQNQICSKLPWPHITANLLSNLVRSLRSFESVRTVPLSMVVGYSWQLCEIAKKLEEEFFNELGTSPAAFCCSY